MGNELNELTDTHSEGNDIGVINKQIPVKIGFGTIFLEILLWILGIIPGIIYTIKKVHAKEYLQKLQQKLQHGASQIDNFMTQRYNILINMAQLVEKSVALDKETFTKIAELRSGNNTNQDETRNQVTSEMDKALKNINVAFESYPELKAHENIQKAMQENSYLQREITAAREYYNDTVLRWNQDIFKWPVYQSVAAKNNYTTRIPFAASSEIKQKASGTFF